jgi:TPR repeat protein
VQLGDAYDTGAGVKRDVAEAIKWYRKAAEQGNAGAGVLKDETEALAWFMLSAAAGNTEAAKQRDVLERFLDIKDKQLVQERSKKIAQEIAARRSTSPTKEKTKDIERKKE